jgi:hypothetical protein
LIAVTALQSEINVQFFKDNYALYSNLLLKSFLPAYGFILGYPGFNDEPG